MKGFFIAFKIILVFTAILFFNFQAEAQTSKSKPKPTPPKLTPKTSATPKTTPGNSSGTNSGLAKLESDVLDEIKNLRANPASYVKYLEQMKSSFNGNFVDLQGGGRLVTSEGTAGVDDAIADLKVTNPVAALKLAPGLIKAAADHVSDMEKNDLSGHKGSDGSWPPNRVDRYGTWGILVRENISYRAHSARDIVLNMLVDDGNPKRDHRKNLLNPSLRFIGLSSGANKTYGDICVVVLTGEFSEKSSGARSLKSF
jgi:uncharacterized protein YkwD